ncbi:MAG: OsmC family protein [Piscinibacter sp.]|nr:OsmC family protein [Piscinibacter sp.]
MSLSDIAAAQQRVVSVLRQRPAFGVQADAPALARWEGALRARTTHDNGTEVVTDMPAEIGGGASSVTPGWLLRAALASCAVTRIAMLAATEGLVLETLEARATSRSDARGLFGMADADGCIVTPGPGDVQLHVRIGAPGVAPERLRALVAASAPLSPVTSALQEPLTVAMHVDVAVDGEAQG